MARLASIPLALLLSAGMLSAAWGDDQAPAQSLAYAHSSRAAKLVKTDTKVGKGAEAKPGHQVTVHYTGWLYDAKAPDHKGTKFDSSLDHGQPFTFPLGAGEVIKGWDQGVAGMKVGQLRKLTIPPELAYGARGFPPVIPPNSTLVFEVELLAMK